MKEKGGMRKGKGGGRGRGKGKKNRTTTDNNKFERLKNLINQKEIKTGVENSYRVIT